MTSEDGRGVKEIRPSNGLRLAKSEIEDDEQGLELHVYGHTLSNPQSQVLARSNAQSQAGRNEVHSGYFNADPQPAAVGGIEHLKAFEMHLHTMVEQAVYSFRQQAEAAAKACLEEEMKRCGAQLP